MEWLPWTDAAGLAAGSAMATPLLVSRRRRWPGAAATASWTRELTVMFGLYALWQFAGDLSLGSLSGAAGRGRDIYRLERDLGLPTESALQQIFLGQHWVLRLANIYYVGFHVGLLGAALVWVFARHRDRYPAVRNVLALSTGACLLVALVPVAPPRLVPGLGLVDTGRLVGPTVYPVTDRPGLDQLSAMPSVHVAWAMVVAFAVIYVLRSPWRWAAVLYPIATTGIVVITGNHYWADGAVAALIVGASIWTVSRVGRRRPLSVSSTDAPDHGLAALSGPGPLPAPVLRVRHPSDRPTA